MLDLSDLNENQRNVVTSGEGPVLVLAGPGSGKTRVLTYRIAHIIEKTPGKHFKILGLTFTNAAAAEMKERIASLVTDAASRTLLTTFHSFAADLLRQHGHHIGLRPDFTILAQDADRYTLLDEAIYVTTGLDDYQVSSDKLLPLVTRMIENNIDQNCAPQSLPNGSVRDPVLFSKIYISYRKLMIERNSLDFVTLISEALTLLNKQVGVRKQVQRVYPYICVDEFQDTNLSQYKILRFLVREDIKNLFVVADDDQIIYQWNGASPERLTALRNDFEMKLVQLPENYRCPAEVVKLANNLIRHNFGRFEGKSELTALKPVPAGSVIFLRKFPKFDEEAYWVAQDICTRSTVARQKCVVLARTRKLLEQIISAMKDLGLSGYLAVRKTEFESAPLRWIHSVMRLANARSNQDFLRRVCKAFYSLDGIDLNVRDIMARSAVEERDYLRSWIRSALSREQLSAKARSLLEGPALRLAERMDFWSFEIEAFSWLDSLSDIAPDQEGIFDEYEEEKRTWHALSSEICVQYGRQEVTLSLLLQELDLRSKSPSPPKDGIPCFTIHASKGLEFDHVYLIGMVEDQLPSWAAVKKGEDSLEMREERRNCFVAITRAQETLTLTYSESLMGWPKKPSRFLNEMWSSPT